MRMSALMASPPSAGTTMLLLMLPVLDIVKTANVQQTNYKEWAPQSTALCTEKCYDGSCIDGVLLCDGKPDCADKSDELNCDGSCTGFMCGDGACIDLDLFCDGFFNCTDRSDERNCHAYCQKYECDDGSCITPDLLCNGKAECTDWSDEQNCAAPCTGLCNDGHCIDADLLCDGKPDCADMSDELDCGGSCTADEFNCTYGHCIDAGLVCNGKPDCADKSDERDCPPPCIAMCYDGSCIQRDLLCDGKPDCADESDELYCNPTMGQQCPCISKMNAAYEDFMACDKIEAFLGCYYRNRAACTDLLKTGDYEEMELVKDVLNCSAEDGTGEPQQGPCDEGWLQEPNTGECFPIVSESPLEDERGCNEQPCPIDGSPGAWGEWSAWTRSRSRHCDDPAPQHGGADCNTDDLEEKESCMTWQCTKKKNKASRRRRTAKGGN